MSFNRSKQASLVQKTWALQKFSVLCNYVFIAVKGHSSQNLSI